MHDFDARLGYLDGRHLVHTDALDEPITAEFYSHTEVMVVNIMNTDTWNASVSNF